MARNKSRSITARPRISPPAELLKPTETTAPVEEAPRARTLSDGRVLGIGVLLLTVLFGGLATIVLLSRDPDNQLRAYSVPRPEIKTRLLAAIFPREKETWFFKLVGPLDAVEKNAESFKGFIRSVHFTGKDHDAIEWRAPTQWKKGPVTAMRYATFYLDKEGEQPELTVVKFPGEGGALLANINRWRKQDLGLRPIGPDALIKNKEEVIKTIMVDKAPVRLVDMRGPGGPKPAKPKAAAALPENHWGLGGERTTLKFDDPPGWKKLPDPQGKGGMTIHYEAHFGLGEGEHQVRIKVMRSKPGTVLMNINRWCDQLGLPPIQDKADLKRATHETQVGSKEAVALDLYGKKGSKPEGILAVLVSHQGDVWTFNLMGPAERVRAQKPVFEKFLSSVRFEEK